MNSISRQIALVYMLLIGLSSCFVSQKQDNSSIQLKRSEIISIRLTGPSIPHGIELDSVNTEKFIALANSAEYEGPAKFRLEYYAVVTFKDSTKSSLKITSQMIGPTHKFNEEVDIEEVFGLTLAKRNRTEITGDTTYFSEYNSDLKVYLMYSNYVIRGTRNLSSVGERELDLVRLYHTFSSVPQPYLIQHRSCVRLGGDFRFYHDKLVIDKYGQEDTTGQKLSFTTGWNMANSDSLSWIYRGYNLSANYRDRLCSDTMLHDFKLVKDDKVIQFKDLLNITVFEADLNRDEVNELYVISYNPCGQKFRVYQIE